MKICIIGLGYVGMPLFNALSEYYDVIGVDQDIKKCDKVKRVEKIPDEDFDVYILCLPTPATKDGQPDTRIIESVVNNLRGNSKRRPIVVLESTVYPGFTRKVIPNFFRAAYSPERINPGDDEHSLEKMVKLVSGEDEETSKEVAEIYRKITKVHECSSLEIAEMAKVIENIQRDVNIALFNEISEIATAGGIPFDQVVQAASTKWNFHKYAPGMVGGHCLSQDPYYLAHYARMNDIDPKMILSGRATNEAVPKRIAREVISACLKKGIAPKKILIDGYTYKANVPDTRNSGALILGKVLEDYGCDVDYFDDCLETEDVSGHFNAVIFASPHQKSIERYLKDPKNLSGVDVFYDVMNAVPEIHEYLNSRGVRVLSLQFPAQASKR